jgi:hypothetical protein
MVAGYRPTNRPVAPERAGKTESGEAVVFAAEAMAHDRRHDAVPAGISGNFLLLTTRETRYKSSTVQAGTPMTVKEMGPASVTGQAFL